MKKLLIIISLIVLAGFGCVEKRREAQKIKTEVDVLAATSATEQNVAKPNEEGKSTTSSLPILEQKGYFVEGNYLWKDGKKVFDKPLEFVLYGSENPYLEYGLWHTLEGEDTTKLFLWRGGGCEGCVALAEKYIVVDKGTQNLSIETFQDADLSALFQRGTIDLTLFSPSGTEVAFFTFEENADGDKTREPESIWVFDLNTSEEEKVAMVADGHSVLDCPPEDLVCSINSQLLYWDANTQKLIVKAPTKTQAATVKQEISLRTSNFFASQVPYNNPWPSAHAFDFNADGFDEYVVYFQDVLPQSVPVGFSKTDRNGVFWVFQWKDHEWRVIYKGEGTVGKQGYGVYSVLKQESFFSVVDVDSDGEQEVKISSVQDATGGYVDSYILKWKDGQIIKASFLETKTQPKLKELFLKPSEEFGPGGLDFLSICSDGSEPNCSFRQGAPGAIGRIMKKLKYDNGVFTVVSYEREDY